jgi:hypothetical protein
MEGFFYRADSERRRIEAVRGELSRVGLLIRGYEKQKGGYTVPKQFESGWIFYIASDGNVKDEMLLRKNYTTLQILERTLYRQIKTLKELESIHKK